MKIKLQERIEALPSKKIVDDGENWVLRDVVLLSEYSKNMGPFNKPRRYPAETMERSVGLFEGLQVNCNHPRRNEDSARDVLMTLGKVTSPRVRKSMQEGKNGKAVNQVIGDVILVKGAASDHIVKLAKLDARLAGMSITGDGDFKESKDFDEVHELRPMTVDVVHRPATTSGFFESIEEIYGVAQKVKNMSFDDAELEYTKLCAAADEASKSAVGSTSSLVHQSAATQHRAAQEALEKAAMVAFKEGEMKVAYELLDERQRHWNAEMMHQDIARLFDQQAYPAPTQLESVQAKDNEAALEKDEEEADEMEDDEAAAKVEEKPEAPEPELPINVTANANQMTAQANLEKTSQAHVAAIFAHAGAASEMYTRGDMVLALEHLEKSKEHEAMAERLRMNEKPMVQSPMPAEKKEQVEPAQAKDQQEGRTWLGNLYEVAR